MLASLLSLSSLALAGCAAETHADLSEEVAGLVKPGMPLDEARAALEKAGYRCGPSQLAGDDPAATLCSRERSHHVVSTCVQQILLTPASEGARVQGLDVREPQCTGV
ncbi:hypothetical protein [Croceibacterium xixiisoli]|uniref:hypothetical protein n=1 Tax=Croceibacterium xixiisoli TaxID=1476466 RepID=UPI00136CB8D6|nr:hypothetical protein [Croceibacterium xixiisoli]